MTVDDSTGEIGTVSGPIIDEDRWTFTGHVMVRFAGRFHWRAEYERIDEKERIGTARFTQHLLSLMIGRQF